MTDLLSVISWWLAVTAIGLLAWPIQFHLLGFLPDRGYSLTKTAGLLAMGYAGWLLGNFGFTRVDSGGVVAALLVVAAVSLAALKDRADDMREWWRQSRWVVLAVELVFAAAFAAWAYARALNPTITATEKPMEFGFLNSVLRTGTQPPGDPWLAGYAISYYHFGYVIMGMLTAVTGVPPSVAFNLGIALLFSLTAVGAFGVALNLITAASEARDPVQARPARRSVRLAAAIAPALLGPVFMLIGNFNGALEVAHHNGWFAVSSQEAAVINACPVDRRFCLLCELEACAEANPRANFWTWLDIKWTNEPPLADAPAESKSASWTPDRFLWWWQSSRVIHDRDLTGAEVEVIDEFPFFSFLLGDMHPHVLGLPFVFLAVAFGLNLFLTVQAEADVKTQPFDRARPFAGLGRLIPLALPDLLWGAVILGGLSFLNTWDFPIYVFVVAAAYTAARAAREGWAVPVWRDSLALALGLATAGVLLYLPFYIGFRSQLGGILPNLIYGTRLPQFLVMFGPSLTVVLAVLGWLAAARARHMHWQYAAWVGGSVLGGLIFLAVFLAVAAVALFGNRPEVQSAINAVIGAATSLQDAPALILRRRLEIERFLTPVFITAILIGGVAVVLGARGRPTAEGGAPAENGSGADSPAVPLAAFLAILIITGALLTLGPEFVYLRDLFGTRMNTIFKFYYQAWVLWSLAAAFGSWILFRYAGPVGKALFGGGVSTAVLLGLIYPILATGTITDNWRGTTRNADGQPYATLDGMAYMQRSRAADYEAIMFLNRTVQGRPVIVEAVGGSYTEYARVSAHTGLPTVIGWPFHEYQWRGSTEVLGGREEDVRLIYTSGSWEETQPVLDKYDVRYVYVGPMEFSQYGTIAFEKFDRNLSKIYEWNGVIIYEYRGGS